MEMLAATGGATTILLLLLLPFFIIISHHPTLVSSQTTWANTVKTGDQRTTKLQFYFHDIVSGKDATAVKVAQATGTDRSPTAFGSVTMADDKLTEGPEPSSKIVGRAQGLYASACQEELGLLMAMSYSFTDGIYKGSSVSILGRNTVMHPVRELPVVGGTGVFRMARGFALAKTNWFSMSGDAIVGYNVTVIH